MDAVDAVVPHERHRTIGRDAHGITLYQPSNRNPESNRRFDEALDFAKQTRWDEFPDGYVR